MHMIFTEEELRWIDIRQFGWPIKPNCPQKIMETIMKKKETIDNQFGDRNEKIKVLRR